jgi:peptidoglycan/xylan/chitin deacetylase (PgdA/CDA1 family)
MLKNKRIGFKWVMFIFLINCRSGGDSKKIMPVADTLQSRKNNDSDTLSSASANASAILSRKQIPILCYHQIREWRPTDSKRAKDYIVPAANFRDQLKMLAGMGYHAILPDQLISYLTNGTSLPDKPILLTFDDTDLDQYSIAFSEMKKYGFKGVFFIMTVSLGRPKYMNKEQVRELSEAGNIIGSHTWDHHNVKKYHADDWAIQIDKPTKLLESITGKTIRYFAYPFGLWDRNSVEELKKRGFKAAFQLSGKRDERDPLYTIRRIIVPGYWNLLTLRRWMNQSF